MYKYMKYMIDTVLTSHGPIYYELYQNYGNGTVLAKFYDKNLAYKIARYLNEEACDSND